MLPDAALAPNPLNFPHPSPAGVIRPLLSIVTPAFNAGEFLPALIESVAALPPSASIEWVLVDDGSTDDTARLFAGVASSHANWRLLQQSNQGVAAARNRGLDEVAGEYIWFVDADDMVLPSSYAALAEAAMTQPDVIAFQAVRFATGEADRNVYKHAKPSTATGEDWVALLLRQKEWRHFLWQHWYRRQHLLDANIRFKEGIIHEDIAVVTEAALRAKRVAYVAQAAYRYRANPQSLTSSRNETRLLARIDSYFAVIEQLRDINRRTAMRTATHRLLQGEVIGQALQIFEVAKQLENIDVRRDVVVKCRRSRLAEGLFADISGFKRLRQVLSMWMKQMGYLPIGHAKEAR